MPRQLTEAEARQYEELLKQLDRLQQSRQLAEHALYSRLCVMSLEHPDLIVKVHGSTYGLLEAHGYKKSIGNNEDEVAHRVSHTPPALKPADLVAERPRRHSRWMVWDYMTIREMDETVVTSPAAMRAWEAEQITAPMDRTSVSKDLGTLDGAKPPRACKEQTLRPAPQGSPVVIQTMTIDTPADGMPVSANIQERKRRQTLRWSPQDLEKQEAAEPAEPAKPPRLNRRLSCTRRRPGLQRRKLQSR